MILQEKIHPYEVVWRQKNFGAPTPPSPGFGGGVEVWSVGQKSRFFDLRWGSLGCCVASKIFVAASYRVTLPGRKNFGVGGPLGYPVGAEKRFKLQNGGF